MIAHYRKLGGCDLNQNQSGQVARGIESRGARPVVSLESNLQFPTPAHAGSFYGVSPVTVLNWIKFGTQPKEHGQFIRLP